MKEQNFKWDKLTLGVCYYPEHWDEALWREDLKRMKDMGIFVLRIGEFAWNLVEVEEGVFDFSFFDHFLEMAAEEDMKVIFGTPTATPPAWMSEKYPEILNAKQDGTLYRHGMRRHYNYTSIVYKEFTKRIVKELAIHYGQNKTIVGWQVDNELNCETDEFYAESDTLEFRRFLKRKYKTLDTLNKAWGSVVWNQGYSSWDQIYVPRTTIHNSTNPHQVLDYKRFISQVTVDFCKMQAEILRKYISKEQYITTNGMFGNINNHKMMEESLDVYTYDSYPNFAFCLGEDPKTNAYLNDRKWSNNLLEVRSVCPHFGIMEQQAGANGWNTRIQGVAPKPGQLKLWTMQSIAHGADFVSYFRFRTSIMGTEIYWHGIYDYDNCDNRKVEEVKEVYRYIQKINETVNAECVADVAVVKDYDNTWDSELDVWHKELTPRSEKEIFVATQLTHTPMEYAYLLDNTKIEDLKKYSMLIYPHAHVLSQEKANLLTEYVEQGGTLILGCRTGMKDETGKCVMMKMPGLLAQLTGTTVKEYTLIGPNDEAVVADWADSNLEMPVFNDVLEVEKEDAEILATYKNTYYEGEPALIKRKVGKGNVVLLGSGFSRNNTKQLLEYFKKCSPFESYMELPEECELVVKQKENNYYFFVLNYAATDVEITLKKAMKDLDTEEEVLGKVILSKYETKVYRVGL